MEIDEISLWWLISMFPKMVDEEEEDRVFAVLEQVDKGTREVIRLGGDPG